MQPELLESLNFLTAQERAEMDSWLSLPPEIAALAVFTQRQQEAYGATFGHKYVLYGGARGGGKSWWLRTVLVVFLVCCYKILGLRGVRVMLACENYPVLRERQITKIEQWPAWLGTYHSQRNEFVLADKYGGGVIALRNLDDPSKYQSAEYAAIGIDEVTKNPERAFHILRGSLRWPGIEETKMLFTANPDSGWVRDYFISHQFPEELRDEADQFIFVPALPTDNPHLPQSYWQMLETLPGALREAWLKGNWFAAVEGLVYGNVTEDNITDREPTVGRAWKIAIDDGYIDPRGTLFIQRQADGAVLIFDELYETQTLEEVTIANIGKRATRHNLVLPRQAIVSHEAVALRQRLTNARIPAVNWMEQRAGGGGSTRLAAITLTRSMFCDGQGKRNILIHRRCKHLLDELRSGYKYPEGKHGLETQPEDGNDHLCQALESYIWHEYGGVPARRPRVREY